MLEIYPSVVRSVTDDYHSDDEAWEDVESVGSDEDLMEAEEEESQEVTVEQEAASEIMKTLQKSQVIPQVFSLVSALCNFNPSVLSGNNQLKKLAAW